MKQQITIAMLKIGDKIRIKKEYWNDYLGSRFGKIESIDCGWVRMNLGYGILTVPVDRVQLDIYN